MKCKDDQLRHSLSVPLQKLRSLSKMDLLKEFIDMHSIYLNLDILFGVNLIFKGWHIAYLTDERDML